jgi:NADH-quinone oxidoreductase subunit M
LAGVYVAVRFVLPVCPDWALSVLGWWSLATALYAAGLSVVQTDLRRFLGYQFVGHAAMVAVGLQLNTPISLTGALCLWFSVALSLAGQGIALRAVEARFGPLPLTGYRGLYDRCPLLAVAFLLTGLGSVGFPGTLGFVAAEMLAGGAVGASPAVGAGLIVASALNGIAVVRVYFLLFTGGRGAGGVPVGVTGRERVAVLSLTGLLLGGGVYPQPAVESRHRAAAASLAERHQYAASPRHDGQHAGEGHR